MNAGWRSAGCKESKINDQREEPLNQTQAEQSDLVHIPHTVRNPWWATNFLLTVSHLLPTLNEKSIIQERHATQAHKAAVAQLPFVRKCRWKTLQGLWRTLSLQLSPTFLCRYWVRAAKRSTLNPAHWTSIKSCGLVFAAAPVLCLQAQGVPKGVGKI